MLTRARSWSAALTCGDPFAESLLELLIGGNAYGAAVACAGHGALGTLWAAMTCLRIELDDGTRTDGLEFAGRAEDGEVAQVEAEAGFGIGMALNRTASPAIPKRHIGCLALTARPGG